MRAIDEIMIVTPAKIYDEYLNECIQAAIIHLGIKEFERIKRLQDVIRREKLFKIADFKYIEFYETLPLIPLDDLKNILFINKEATRYLPFCAINDDIRLECDQINIFQDSIRYIAYVKHSNVEVASDIINTEDIEKAFNGEVKLGGAEEYYEAYHITLKEAPLYINSDEPNEKFYATELLKQHSK